MTRQLRQILMFWPESAERPLMTLSIARDPLKNVSRPPDETHRLDDPEVELVIYYWGAKREINEIIGPAYWGVIVP